MWNDRFVGEKPALYVLTKNLQDFPAVSLKYFLRFVSRFHANLLSFPTVYFSLKAAAGCVRKTTIPILTYYILSTRYEATVRQCQSRQKINWFCSNTNMLCNVCKSMYKGKTTFRLLSSFLPLLCWVDKQIQCRHIQKLHIFSILYSCSAAIVMSTLSIRTRILEWIWIDCWPWSAIFRSSYRLIYQQPFTCHSCFWG